MSSKLGRRRYFPNHLTDYDGKATVEEIQTHYTPDLLQEIDHLIELIRGNVKCDPRSEDGGLYVGLSGVVYALFRISQSEKLPGETRNLCLELAGQYLAASLEYCEKKSESKKCTGVAFLLGHLGVYALAVVYFTRTGDIAKKELYLEKFIGLHTMCKPVDYLACGGDELLVGRAGYLCGALWIQQQLGSDTIPPHVIQAIVTSLVKSGRAKAVALRSPSPLMYSYYNSLYLGAAHGISAILQMLLSYSGYLDTEATKDVQAASYCLLSCQTDNSNFPACLDESSDNLWHWCHGAPGVIYFLIKAHQVIKDKKFGEAAVRAGGDNLWKYGLLQKGPGICHGIAGSGYAFLALFRATRQTKHLYRAQQFAQFLFTKEFGEVARNPDCPYSLYEGWAGTLCFLVDLLDPENSAFPFFDIFK